MRIRSAAIYTSIAMLSLSIACKKSNGPDVRSSQADLLSFSLVANVNDEATFYPNSTVRVRVPDSITAATNSAAYFTASPGAHVTANGISQVSGNSRNNFEGLVDYKVVAADNTEKTFHILAMNNDFTYNWGMGQFLKQSLAEDVSYEWYIDQSTTGTYAAVNCGPTSVTMASKWSDPNFSKTPLDARNTYRSGGGWWYTDDVDNYLSANGIPHAIIPLGANATGTMQDLVQVLNKNEIVILCIDMNQMRAAGQDAYHVDKFYSTTPDWGHFFVVKGYEVVDGETYFQIYDPFSFGQTNADNGKLKGRDRFYRYEDVAAATSVWWNFAFVVAKKGQTVDDNAIQKALDPFKVPRAHSN